MDAAILNIQWLAKDWGEDLGKFFRVGKEEAGGAGGGGWFGGFAEGTLEDSTPFNQSTVPDKEHKWTIYNTTFRGPSHDAIIKPRCE